MNESNFDGLSQRSILQLEDAQLALHDRFNNRDRPNRMLKQGIWLYFLLLLFEGALRKWVFPGLATPLLLVRDPIALALIYLAWKNALLPRNFYLSGIVVIGIIGIFTAVFFGHGNLYVALYGARILILHFPLIFVIGSVFEKEDVIAIGKLILLIAFPMVLIIGLQFYSPQSAWINRGIGGDIEGGGFSGALGFYRPSGTFSFTNGNSLFFSLLASFILYFWLEKGKPNKLLLIGASLALLFSIPLSISRSLLFYVLISLMFAVVASSRKPEYFRKILIVSVGCLIALAILLQTSYFGTATEAFASRYESANETEGGLEGVVMDRFLGGLVGALTGSVEVPFFGYGLGMGTNVGSMLLVGDTYYLIAEAEWGRLIGESGQLFGLLLIFLRVSLTIKLTTASFKELSRENLLPWMLMSFGFLNLSQGGWAQPTSLGFCVMIAGLVIAAFKKQKESLVARDT